MPVLLLAGRTVLLLAPLTCYVVHGYTGPQPPARCFLAGKAAMAMSIVSLGAIFFFSYKASRPRGAKSVLEHAPEPRTHHLTVASTEREIGEKFVRSTTFGDPRGFDDGITSKHEKRSSNLPVAKGDVMVIATQTPKEKILSPSIGTTDKHALESGSIKRGRDVVAMIEGTQLAQANGVVRDGIMFKKDGNMTGLLASQRNDSSVPNDVDGSDKVNVVHSIGEVRRAERSYCEDLELGGNTEVSLFYLRNAQIGFGILRSTIPRVHMTHYHSGAC